MGAIAPDRTSNHRGAIESHLRCDSDDSITTGAIGGAIQSHLDDSIAPTGAIGGAIQSHLRCDQSHLRSWNLESKVWFEDLVQKFLLIVREGV